MNRSSHPRACRSLLLALLALPELSAQTTVAPPPDDGNVQVLERFVATGSNIKRMDQEKVLPVTVLDMGQIEARDAVTPMELLASIPQVTNIPNNETSTNAVAARGDNANVALRGLGAQNTLVVLNGRRVPFHPFNTSSVNVNTLPTFGLAQIEILRDGASAIYGSDAVAGVINYVTQKRPSGGEISLRYGVTEHGGGMDIQTNIGYGLTFADGKGSWLINVTGYNRDAIYWREREWSKTGDKIAQARPPWNVPGSNYDGLTATAIWPSFRNGTAVTGGTVNWFYPNASGTPALTTTALPRQYYADYNDYTMGQPMTARGTVYNRIEYELTPQIRAFGEVSGYLSKSQTVRQPITLTATDAGAVTLSIDNPYNPYGNRFNAVGGTPNADGTPRVNRAATAITMNTMIMADGGPEEIEATDRMYRLLGGLGGTIGTSTWTWESAAMIGGVRVTDSARNSIRESLLKQSAARTGTDAWNPFGYTFKVENGAVVIDKPYTNPDAVRDFYTESADRLGHSRIASVDLRAGGEVFELWAGPIAGSVGTEWRYEAKADRKNPFASTNPPGSGLNPDNNDILVMSPKPDYSASRTIASAFAETVVPLATAKNNIPFVQLLEANASVRFESYSDFGETTKPKFGINWKPLNWLMVRGSINKGFRAPDLADLYQPASFTVGSPPGTRDAVRNNFFTGVGNAADTQVLARTYTIANPALQPEESDGRSVGVVVEVPVVKGLSFSVDYWEIEQASLILAKGRDASLDEQLLRAYTQAQLAAGRNINDINVGFRLDPGDTAGGYVGDPNTLRAAVTEVDRALFAAANAKLPQSQWLAPVGAWIGSTTQNINGTGNNFTNGFDYTVSYDLRKTPIGQFRVSTEWSQFLNKFVKETPNDPKDDDINAMVIADWKGSTTIQWRKEAWTASLTATYQTDVRSGATTNAATYEALGRPSYIRPVENNGTITYYEEGEDQLQLNFGVGYRFGAAANSWLRNTSFRLGINNLLDEEPNRTSAAAGYSGTTGSSLWVGRAYSLNVSREF